MIILVLAAGLWFLMNSVAFHLYYSDKKKAIHHEWRIPEWVLLLIAVPGPFGALLGMLSFHHKTKKWYFCFWVGLWIVLQILFVVFVILAMKAFADSLADGIANFFKSFKNMPG